MAALSELLLVEQVWKKGRIVEGNDPNIWRQDRCGAWMQRLLHGNRNSQYGWEMDHIHAHGPDDVSNLQPLQWENNVDKSDGMLKCNVTSHGINNVKRR